MRKRRSSLISEEIEPPNPDPLSGKDLGLCPSLISDDLLALAQCEGPKISEDKISSLIN